MEDLNLNLENVNDVANTQAPTLDNVAETTTANTGLANDDFAELTGSIITDFKVKTTLAVGEHSVALDSVEEGTSASGSPKLTFIFKDRKGGTAVETLSFGNFETSAFTFNRVKYLLDTVKEKVITVGDKQYAIQQLIQHVDGIYTSIINSAVKAGTAIKIVPDVNRDEEMDADDLASAENEREIEAMKAEHKNDMRLAYNADMKAKYDSYRAKGFQIFRPKGAKNSYAIPVDKKTLQSIFPIAKLLFPNAIKCRFAIEIKKERQYLNVKSITPIHV